VPNHAPGLIVGRASDLQTTVTNIEMAKAMETVEDPDEEAIQSAIEEDAVDILLALGTLAFEYDIDIAETFRQRVELIEDYRNFEDAMEEAESQEEMMDAIDEHMSEELDQMIGGGFGGMGGNLGGVEAGTNVDAEDYDHEESDKSFQ
jgi:hypothetical protein